MDLRWTLLDSRELHSKCAVAALRQGYNIFAVQDGEWCASSATAQQTNNKYGKSTGFLTGGKGGNMANQVYAMEAKKASYRSQRFPHCLHLGVYVYRLEVFNISILFFWLGIIKDFPLFILRFLCLSFRGF